MFVRCIAAGLALSAAVAAPAGAATFTTGPNGLVFTAAPAVENDIGIYSDPQSNPRTLIISTVDDQITYSNAPLPTGCRDIDPAPSASPAAFVECTGAPPVTFDLGDLVDKANITGAPLSITVLGGPGNDVLKADGGAQTLVGGDGNDVLEGGADADVLDGGDGNDNVRGDSGDDELRGGPGLDGLSGGQGNDKLDGGDGHDEISAGAGDDLANGGAGDDELEDDDGVDTLRGDDGSDVIYGFDEGQADTFDGGGGIDGIAYVTKVPITLDLAAGTVKGAGPPETVIGVEDIIDAQHDTGTLVGTAGANYIEGAPGADVVDPRAGGDVVATSTGDDTIDVRDGFADRVSCGDGADSVQADTLDDVQPDCETVTHTDAGDAGEDRPPTVAITAPAATALLSTVAPNTITATATDDRGIAKVVFSTGERTLCTDTAAPYACDYRPTSADVGRDTLVAIAVDTAGQTASAVRVVAVPRFTAGLTAKTTPKRDRKAPYSFTTKGKLALPAGVLPAAGCTGTVDVSFKAGKKTVSSRRVKLESDCTYASKVTFRLPRRLNPKRLAVVVVHGGNAVVEGSRANRHTVRPR